MRRRASRLTFYRQLILKDISFQTLRKVMTGTAIIFLVFSIVISINLFVTANKQANDAYVVEQTVSEATSIAETLKSSNGDLTLALQMLRSHKHYTVAEDALILFYDERMLPTSESLAVYKAAIRGEGYPAYCSYSIRFMKVNNQQEIYHLEFKYLRGGDA